MTRELTRKLMIGTVAAGFLGVWIPDSMAVRIDFEMGMSASRHDTRFPADHGVGVRPRLENTDDRPVTMPGPSTLQSLVASTDDDPRTICREIKQRVKYAPDIRAEDEWRTPRETLKLGKGSCEDFAGCVAAVCETKGISAKVYVMASKVNKRSHAVTIGENGGKMWMSSNGSFAAVLTLSDAKDKVCREMGWSYDDVTMK